jgi:serine/threonine protein kinase
VLTLFENISKCTYDIPDSVPEPLADLIRRILNPNRDERYTIQQIRDHPYVELLITQQPPPPPPPPPRPPPQSLVLTNSFCVHVRAIVIATISWFKTPIVPSEPAWPVHALPSILPSTPTPSSSSYESDSLPDHRIGCDDGEQRSDSTSSTGRSRHKKGLRKLVTSKHCCTIC